MPRGNPAVWKNYGSSYADLSSSDQHQRNLASTNATLPFTAELMSMPAAGAPTAMRPRGAGSFALQNTWSLGTSGTTASNSTTTSIPSGTGTLHGSSSSATCSNSRLQTATEAKSRFQAPPEDFKRRGMLKPDMSQFPRPNYPNPTAYQTSTQADFKPDVLQRAERLKPTQQRDSGRLLLVDVPPQFTTQAQTDYHARTAAEMQATRGRGAGRPVTDRSPYNIITGSGSTLTNNAFEHWDGRDYRRHR